MSAVKFWVVLLVTTIFLRIKPAKCNSIFPSNSTAERFPEEQILYLRTTGDLQSSGDECNPAGLPEEKRCNETISDACTKRFLESGYLKYAQYYYCDLEGYPGLGLTLLIVWLLFLFFSMGVIGSKFFSPIMAGIAREFELSHNLAGVTLLAISNGIDDILVSYIAITNNNIILGISGVLGGVAFVSVAELGLVVLLANTRRINDEPHSTLATIEPAAFRILPAPFVRDVVLLLVALGMVYGYIQSGMVNIAEAGSLTVVYIIYLCTVFTFRRYYRSVLSTTSTNEPSRGTSSSSNTSTKKSALTVQLMDRNSGESSYETPSHPSFDMTISVSREGDEPKYGFQKIPPRKVANRRRTEDEAKAVLSDIKDSEESGSRRSSILSAISDLKSVETQKRSLLCRWCSIVARPVEFLASTTIPMPNERFWNWRIAVITPVTSPFTFCFAIQVLTLTVGKGKGVPIIPFVMLGGLFCSIWIFVKLRRDTTHLIYVRFFLVLGLMGSLGWLYFIANEVINLLLTVGEILNIHSAIIGITVLAWGTSAEDLVANVTIARYGFPRMSMSTCIAGPLLNLTLGVGIPLLINTLYSGWEISLLQSGNISLAFAFIALSMLLNLTAIPCFDWKFSNRYGLFNIAVYFVFISVSVFISAFEKVIPFDIP